MEQNRADVFLTYCTNAVMVAFILGPEGQKILGGYGCAPPAKAK